MDANKTASITNRLAQAKEAAADLADAQKDLLLLVRDMRSAPFIINNNILARKSAEVNRGFDENAPYFLGDIGASCSI